MKLAARPADAGPGIQPRRGCGRILRRGTAEHKRDRRELADAGNAGSAAPLPDGPQPRLVDLLTAAGDVRAQGIDLLE